ncbi:Uncharacterized protein dnm_071330 [Desulfonema magnum]|uniref:Uncharacterized protein n=1 Tax=Desulfonema magnum TaxID=45655 RepID=A0A975BTD5_9BACT|nr:Uncharacterized protein dnm_071330 [Desulfonema magnum]
MTLEIPAIGIFSKSNIQGKKIAGKLLTRYLKKSVMLYG